MADKVATFAINLGGDAREVSRELAAEQEALRARIEASQVAIKGMSGALRSLKGSSQEVAHAKETLRARIDGERGAVSQANLALLKQGSTYEQLTHKMRENEIANRKLESKRRAEEAKKQADEIRKLAEASGKMAAGFKYAGGPLGELSSKMGAFKEVAGGAGGSMALLAAGVGVVVLGVAALTAATITAAEKLGAFIITGANALRSMNLMREAASGSAENAKALGTQVDAMSRKVATSKVELNAMAVAITKSLSGGVSKASGQAIVDTFAAVSQAAAAAGEDTGAALREIIERGKVFGRIQVNPFELQGKGIQFGEIAGALAKNMRVSINDARAALFEGRVKLADGAAALRTAVEQKFGGINKAKLLDIDVQMEKFHEHLVGLTKGVVIEPMLKGIDAFLQKFDETTVTGQSIKLLFTKIGDAIVRFSVAHIDDVVQGVERLVLWGLRAAELFGKWAPKVRGVTDALLGNKVIMFGLQAAGAGIVVAIGAIGLAFGGLVSAFAAGMAVIGAPFYLLYKGWQIAAGLDWGKVGTSIIAPIQRAWDWIKGIKWADLGKSIVMGIVGGLVDAASWLTDGVKGLAEKVKNAFEEALGIHSPSTVFADYGRQTVAGYTGGLEDDRPRAQDAANALVPNAPQGRGSAAGASGGNVTVHFAVNFPESMNREHAQDIAKALTAPSVLGQLTKAIREGLVTQGVPTQATAAP